MRTKQRNNLAETARHERVAQNTDVYAVKARNYKGLRRGSPVFCRNNWHIHHADNGGGQILVCVAGRGYYQEWGKDATLMKPGDCINIPAGVKHWHGAAPDSWFSHLAIEVPGENGSNEWLEALDDEQYGKLKQDKGMFTVDDNLKVVVHPEVESDYLKQYNNKSLYIPENAFFRPDINNLRYHRTHIFGLYSTYI